MYHSFKDYRLRADTPSAEPRKSRVRGGPPPTAALTRLEQKQDAPEHF